MPKMENVIKGSRYNLMDWYMNSSEEQKEYGSNFYYNAHLIATDVGEQLGHCGYDATNIGSAILAILSPRTDWDKNVLYAYEYVNWGGVRNQTEINNAKCKLIESGNDPMVVLGRTSYKVKPFYKAILNPDGDNEVSNLMGFNRKGVKLAVVDRHMGGAYFNRPLKEYQRYYLGHPKVTKRISNATFTVANELKVPVNTVQAVIWATFRDAYKYFTY